MVRTEKLGEPKMALLVGKICRSRPYVTKPAGGYSNCNATARQPIPATISGKIRAAIHLPDAFVSAQAIF